MFAKYKTHLSLALILIFALLTRLYHLTQVPTGFFCDEASRGLDAFSILNSLQDSHGQTLPIFFQALGEFTMPIQIYAMVPFVALFGLTEFAVRATSVFLSLLSVFGVFLIGKQLKDEKTGIFAAFFLSITPLSFHYSRYGAEISAYIAVFSFFLYFFIKSLKHPRFIPFTFIFALLTLYSYNAALVYIPIALIIFFFTLLITKKFHHKHLFSAPVIATLIFLVLPLVFHFISGNALVRWNQVTDNSKFDLSAFTTRYLDQFSFDYLFKTGDNTFINRHLTQGLTPLLLPTLPLILIGVILCAIHYRFLLLLFFFYPLAGAIPSSGPYSSRTVIAATFFAIFAALGLNLIRQKLPKKISVFIISLILLIQGLSFLSFYRFYLSSYPLESSDFWGWQMGPKEIANIYLQQKNNYDTLYFPTNFNAPQSLFDFYLKGECPNCRLGGLENYDRSFKQLFAVSEDEYQKLDKKLQLTPISTLHYPNGKPSFHILSNP